MPPSEPPSEPTPRIRLVGAGHTDVGRQRKHNEDCVLLRPEHDLFVVADGMGGHNAGDVASKLVASSLANYFEATAHGGPLGDLPDEYARLSHGGKRIAAGVRKANLDVFTISNTHAQHHGMGSTVVGIHFEDGWAHIAHVGDSRCYRIRDGHIQQMTRDHSLINDALDMKPDLTPEELKRLPKNIITRALGMKDAVKVDVKSERVVPGDIFLLCSDGLTGMVPPEQILEVITLTTEPQEACELLIAEANDAGGTDNISAVLVRVEDAAEADAVVEATYELDAEHAEIEDHELVEGHELDAEHAEIEDHEVVEHHDIDASSESEGELEGAPGPEPDLAATPVTGALFVPSAPSAPPAPLVSIEDSLGDDAPDDEDTESPTLELTADMRVEELPLLDEDQIADAIAAFARGDAIELDLRGPWPGRLAVRSCASCGHELYPGDSFCTECGARIMARRS